MHFSHYSVMLPECLEALAVKPDGIYVDATLGGGGHSLAIAKRLGPAGRLIGIDTDTDALAAAGKRLEEYRDRITFVHDNFENVDRILDSLSIPEIDGAIIDLGVSSFQLDTPERGFSYQNEAPLDMRMNATGSPEESFSAYTVVNTYPESELRRILFEYGEENMAPRIAQAIVRAREVSPIRTTTELAELVKSVMPKKALMTGHHPAKRTFQAIRIEVNHELSIIEPTLRTLVSRLKSGGRLAVLTFHSLEDRAVKQTFASLAQGCTCPPSFPVCVCGNRPKITLYNKKPILPSEAELAENNRSHSAKLRVAEKI
ncbi:MAG: 16S rRNA (cytosine(1402)-N(4))-methyltransferase RsmH [Ruminococcus sp.]|nr:16S rRNA (cytosine(1402)-N(4))-methyltransferase RsmH [Candidatus Apopatosoma intestinale]